MADEARSGTIGPERIAMLRETLKQKLMARQAAQEKIDRIIAGAPRAEFGDFALSFEPITSGRNLPASAPQPHR